MIDSKLEKEIQTIVKKTIDSMDNMSVPYHYHNSWDSNQLDPSVALTGFPVEQVATASVAPSDTPSSGVFRFRVDTTPTYYLWAYIVYNNAGTLTGAWKSVQLT